MLQGSVLNLDGFDKQRSPQNMATRSETYLGASKRVSTCSLRPQLFLHTCSQKSRLDRQQDTKAFWSLLACPPAGVPVVQATSAGGTEGASMFSLSLDNATSFKHKFQATSVGKHRVRRDPDPNSSQGGGWTRGGVLKLSFLF